MAGPAAELTCRCQSRNPKNTHLGRDKDAGKCQQLELVPGDLYDGQDPVHQMDRQVQRVRMKAELVQDVDNPIDQQGPHVEIRLEGRK